MKRTVERATAQLKAAGYIDVVNHGRWAGYSRPPAWVGGTPAAGGQQTPLNGGTYRNGRRRPDSPDVAVHPHSELKNGRDLTAHR